MKGKQKKPTKPTKHQKEQKPKKKNNYQIKESSFSSEESFDNVFRFDDKLIGKRTNIIFEPKSNSNGFYDLHANQDLNSSIFGSSRSRSFLNVEKISDTDLQKNEKMIRQIQNIDLNTSNIVFSDFGADNTISKSVSKVSPAVSQQNTPDQQDREINENQNPPLEGHDQPIAEVDKQTEKKKKQSINDESQVKQGIQSKSTNQGTTNLNEAQKVQTTDPTEIKIYQNKKDSQTIKQQKNESSSIPKQKNNQINQEREARIKYYKGRASKEIKMIKRNNRKRAPSIPAGPIRPFRMRFEQQRKLPTFIVQIGIEQNQSQQEYEPFGTYAERYPRRIKIDFLRYWLGQRKNYYKGLLKSITLVDDRRGRKAQQTIKEKYNL